MGGIEENMVKKIVTFMSVIVLSGAVAGFAQEKPAPKTVAKSATAKAAPVPEPQPQPVNIKVEIAITDQVGPGEPTRKTVSMIVNDRHSNSIRSSGSFRVSPNSLTRNVTLNVDAWPTILTKENNRISLNLGLEYLPKSPAATDLEPGSSSLNERIVVLLDSGKPVVVSQAADPVSDRKITVEVTATIIK
jgi:hypothetical protein